MDKLTIEAVRIAPLETLRAAACRAAADCHPAAVKGRLHEPRRFLGGVGGVASQRVAILRKAGAAIRVATGSGRHGYRIYIADRVLARIGEILTA